MPLVGKRRRVGLAAGEREQDAPSAPSAATSDDGEPQAAERDASARSAANIATAVSTARATRAESVGPVKIECARRARPGEPRWRARSAPAAVPIAQPASVASAVTPTISVAATSRICDCGRAGPREALANVAAGRGEGASTRESRSRAAARPRRRRESAVAAPRRGSSRGSTAIVSVGAATVKMSERLLERRLRAAEPRVEPRELPVVDRARRDRDDPAVRSRDQRRVGKRRALERQDAVREQDRRPLPPPAPKYACSGAPGTKRRAADDVQERQFRLRRCAADLDELAVATACTCAAGGRCGASSQRASPSTAPRLTNAPPHVACRNTATANGGWPRSGVTARRARRVELPVREARLRRERRDHTAWIARSLGCELRECTLHGAVLHRRAADGGHGEHGRADRDARARRAPSAGHVCAQAEQRVADRNEHAARAPRARGGPGGRLRLRSPSGDSVWQRTPSDARASLFSMLTTNQKGTGRRDSRHPRVRETRCRRSAAAGDQRYRLGPRSGRARPSHPVQVGRASSAMSCRFGLGHADEVATGSSTASTSPARSTPSLRTAPERRRVTSSRAEMSVNRGEVRLRRQAPTRTIKLGIHWARDFEFGATIRTPPGAVAQLGERLAGSQ